MNNVIAIEQNRFYVYGLFVSNERLPFYIGKGTGDRLHCHAHESRRGNTLPVYNKIRKLTRTGYSYDAKILCAGMAEDDALELEELTIATVGRRDLKKGPLMNLTDGGDGRSGYHHTPESIAKIRAGNMGKVNTPETRAKISASAKIRPRKPHSAETRAKMSKAVMGRPGNIPSAEARARMSASLKGRKFSKETRAKISKATMGRPAPAWSAESRAKLSATNTGRTQPRVTCPHCKTFGGKGGMTRYHFDNCKFKIG